MESGVQTTEIYSSLNNFSAIAFANKTHVTVNDTGGGSTFNVDISIAAAGLVDLTVNGGNGADIFLVTPSATIPFTINGGGNPQPAPGNVLLINFFGTTGASLADANSATGFHGSWTFTNRQPVNFTGIESGQAAPPPSISKAFAQATIQVGATSTLTFTITNPNASPLTGVAFADTLPAGVTVATSSATVCGGTLTTTSPGNIALSGATIAASGQCQFSVTVAGGTVGIKNNVTSVVRPSSETS